MSNIYMKNTYTPVYIYARIHKHLVYIGQRKRLFFVHKWEDIKLLFSIIQSNVIITCKWSICFNYNSLSWYRIIVLKFTLPISWSVDMQPVDVKKQFRILIQYSTGFCYILFNFVYLQAHSFSNLLIIILFP